MTPIGQQPGRRELRVSRTHAFTIIEMMVVISILVLLIALLMPALSKARIHTRRMVCASNLGQLAAATTTYTNDYNGVFPPHRHCALNTGRDWFNLLEEYGNSPEVSHCPELSESQTDFGVTWGWNYDAHYIGYGYNGFFLGVYSHPGCHLTNNSITSHGIRSTRWTRISSVVEPTKLIVVGDSHPKSNGGANLGVSLTLWWPFIHSFTEGVNGTRHHDTGVVGMADGHAEIVPDVDENLHPVADGGRDNLEYWDPLQRN